MTSFEIASALTAIIALVLSIVALVYGHLSYRNSIKQFEIANQGFLHLVPTFHLIGNPDNNDASTLRTGASIKNNGNVTLTFKIVKFDTYLDDNRVSEFKLDNGFEIGVTQLFPGEEVGIWSNNIYFSLDKLPVNLEGIKNVMIKLHVIIQFRSESSTKLRTLTAKFTKAVGDHSQKLLANEYRIE